MELISSYEKLWIPGNLPNTIFCSLAVETQLTFRSANLLFKLHMSDQVG